MSRPMKDSGVEWIGEIPEGWHTTKLRNCLRNPITDGPHETPQYVTDGVPFISVNAINWDGTINRDVNTKITLADAKSYNVKANLEIGDILFTKAATIGKTAIVDKVDFMIWSPIAVIKVNEILNNRFLRYIFQCSGYINQVVNLGTRNTQINVGMRAMEQAKIPVCSPVTQIQIANFLDEKTAQIDAIIADTKQSLLEFKKYKRALIIEIVTKGLNPKVNMKDSGIEWVGEIPEHWDVVKIKRLFHEINERNEADEDATLLSLFTAIGVKPRSEMEERGNKAITVINYKIVKPNDLVVNKLLAWMGAIGYSDFEGVTSPDYDVYRALPNANVVRNYYNSYFRYTQFKDDCFKYGRGIMLMRWRTYPEQFKNISVVNPPLSEQQQIAEYLDEKCAHIDSLIADKEKLIGEFEDYKKSLIYEYVTGKKEVE